MSNETIVASSDIYTPKGCITLDKQPEPQFRVGLQGFWKTGKTTSALTFPNPIVFNPDRGLSGHVGRADVIEVPIWNTAYCRSINPNHVNAFQLKDTILMWFDQEAKKLTEKQTLVIDGGTGMQNAYHKWYSVNQVVTKKGDIDDFAQWGLKIRFFADICEPLKYLRCNVIYISHETEKKDKDGSYSGKIRPLLTGQFQDQLGSHFTDWFRQLTKAKNTDTIPDKEREQFWRMTKEEYKQMCDSFVGNAIYYWNTESDDTFDGGHGSLEQDAPRYIPATYAHFQRWKKKIS